MQSITPYYSIDLDVLDATLVRAANQAKAVGITLAMALKGFPLPAAFPTIAQHVAAVMSLKKKGTFEVLIEPCESLTTACGTLTATVLDVIRRETDVAILDVSGACHMPDVINMPYVPTLVEPATASDGWPTVLGGNTCLSADVIGTYRLAKRLNPGDRVTFAEMGAYTFCQANWFNGVRRPAIVVTSRKDGSRTVRSWGEADFTQDCGGG